MTPKRKQALDYIYMNGGDQGEMQRLRDSGRYAPSVIMLIRLQMDELIECVCNDFTLTDKGRRALHEG